MNKAIVILSLCGGLVLASCGGQKSAALAEEFNPVLTVEGGQLQGVVDGDSSVIVYKGVPYAAAPVGENRWRKPQPVEPWEGVRVCDHFGKASVQTPRAEGSFYWKEFANLTPDDIDEDCLYLNIWTPAKAVGHAEAKLPVMVWVHGGAFMSGFGFAKEFDGHAIAHENVILVTINYRLGMLGFLAHPLLTAEDGKSSGNYGHFDQLEALRWISRNIASFGGDPANVTLFGQSAGGASVQTIISSPLAKGVVNRAIIQSGGGLGTFMGSKTLADMEAAGQKMWDVAGCSTLEEMRKVPADQLNGIGFRAGLPGLPFGTCVDGVLLENDVTTVAREGKELDITYLIGNTSEDMMPDQLAESVKGWCLLQEEQGRQPAYAYLFKRDLPGEDMTDAKGNVQNPGAFHSAELRYVFGTVDGSWRPMTEGDYDLSRRMVKYWTNFARTGNPNGKDLPAWEACTKTNPYVHVLDIE